MEEILEYACKIKYDGELLKKCSINLLSVDDIKALQSQKDDWKLQVKISIECDILYDKLYIGKYCDVPEEIKRMFLILSFFKTIGTLKASLKEPKKSIEALKVLDVALMVGSGFEEANLVTEFTQKVHDYVVTQNPVPIASPIPDSCFNTAQHQCDIDTKSQLSLEEFLTRYFHFHHPVKITDSMAHWPATSKWKDMNYFLKLAAFRTVPVELGRTYDDDNWGQNLFLLGDFIRKFMTNEEHPEKGYLAQHDLFDQIPIFMRDFSVPDYCAVGSADPVVIKSWIGPKNTISTMHTDDKHNILCQVVGEKLVILASPVDSENLYPYEGMLSNTTQIDAENLDFDKFPKAKNVKFKKVILKAGEMLYIPKLHWHYVRSLTPSISISFWFDSDE